MSGNVGQAIADEMATRLGVQMPRPRGETVSAPIVFRPILELIATPTQVNWLLPDLIAEGTIVLVAGKRGSFKSFIVLHWLMKLAIKQVPVFLISAEGAGLGRRVEAWLKAYAPNVDPATLPFRAHEQRVDFNDAGSLIAVRAAIDASGLVPKVLVIDTFSKNSGSLDENSNSEVKAFLGRLDTGLRTPLKLTVILVAHTGHSDPTRVRGASAIEADTDTFLLVKRKGQERIVTVDRNRFKDAPEMPPIKYHADEVNLGRDDSEGKPITSLVMLEGSEETCGTVTRSAPKGKAQQEILEVLVKRQAEVESPLIWTIEDMRKIGRNLLGQHKSTALYAVKGLVGSEFLTSAVDGYQLADGVGQVGTKERNGTNRSISSGHGGTNWTRDL